MSKEDTKEDKTKVGKIIFREYADFNCHRNLFLNLSQTAPDPMIWRKEKEILKRSRLRRATESPLAQKRGKNYEQEVYRELARYAERIERRENKKIIQAEKNEKTNVFYRKKFNGQTLSEYIFETPMDRLCLIEHEFTPPTVFVDRFFNLPVSSSAPDILLIHPLDSFQDDIQIINNEGKIVEKKRSEISATHGISVIDIKSIPDDRISVKYISEVIYYLKTLNLFLKAEGLNQFVILGKFNGIFPFIDGLKIYDYEDLLDQLVEIDIDQTKVLFDNTMNIVDGFVAEVSNGNSINRNDIELNLDVHCDQCYFLDDCLKRCGYNQKNEKWDDDAKVDVLPNINSSIVANLKQSNIITVKDLIANLPSLSQSTTPKPINSILPLLDHKSLAIDLKKVVAAKVDDIYSTSIPSFTRNRVTFTLETDSTTDMAYAFGIYFETSINVKSQASYKETYGNWWLNWYQFVQKINEFNDNNYDKKLQDENRRAAIKDIHQRLQMIGFMNLSESDARKFANTLLLFDSQKIQDRRSLRFNLPNSFVENDDELFQLDEDSDGLSIQENGKSTDEDEKKKYEGLRVEIAYVNVSSNITKGAEETFVKQIISTVAKIIQMTVIIENNIEVRDADQGFKTSWANSAFYYWSSEIVEKFEELFENHLQSIIEDSDLYNDLFSVSQWISPSNQVSDPNQVKRLYDVSKFVQSVLGLPIPINYTWHKVAQIILPNYRFSKLYWSPYFNAMDRSHWHEFILTNEKDQLEGTEKYIKIQLQIYYKIRSIARLVTKMQTDALTRPLISRNRITKPKEIKTKVTDNLPSTFHPLARNWYIFARLTEAIDELMIVELRTDYPQAAIGKLEAARVTNLQRFNVGQNKFYYQFDLEGLSRNVKFTEGDSVLLIPINIRDSILSFDEYPWTITIRTMEWDNTTKNYKIETEQTGNIFEKLEEGINHQDLDWYIYPKTGGYWANKLFSTRGKSRSKSLLLKSNMGRTQLGTRLSIMWDLGPVKSMAGFSTFSFPSAQVYMYAPDLIQKYTRLRLPNLLCQPEFPPDPSQEEAIHFALESPLRLILGPPGTGKSQTIVALINEFLLRQHQEGNYQNRILVASFAYTAANVLLDKICQSVDKDGNSTIAAKATKIYIMSKSRELPQLSGTGPTYVVERLSYANNGWDFTMATDNKQRITPTSNKLEDYINEDTIFFGNAHQIYHLDNTDDKGNIILTKERLEFDLIIVDEASQLPTDHMLSIYQHVRSNNIILTPEFIYQENAKLNPLELKRFKIKNPEALKTQIVFVGDDSQLPPVQPILPPEALRIQLGSIFDYYKGGFELDFRQLKFNYRSHDLIVKFTESLGIYTSISASPNSPNRSRLLPGNINRISGSWTKDILEPQKIVVSLTHDSRFDTSVSAFEAELTVDIILNYFKMVGPTNEAEEITFWYEGLGIVAPHNAHSRTIITMLFQRINSGEVNSSLSSTQLMNALKDTIFSVEKFQGSERDLIIGTIGVSAKDQLKAEEEFIYNLNRINVLTTRAKSKMILICSQNFLEHIPNDRERFFDVSILKRYTYKYCNQNSIIQLPGNINPSSIEFYWKSV